MKVAFELRNFSPPLNSSVMTIGNFDGLHLGHRSIVLQVIERSKKMGVPSCLVTFDPHPSHILRPTEKVDRLFSIEDLAKQAEMLGLDHLIVQPFTEEFSNVTAREFLSEYVVAKLKPRLIVVGHDFVFGHGRSGNFKMLSELGQLYGFEALQMPPILIDGELISSSKIRRLIREGQVEKARAYLGRPYYLSGRIVKGEGRGEKLGFATANLETQSQVLPAEGVYLTEFVTRDKKHPSLTNVGHKPTFHNDFALTVETFVLNSKENYYDQNVNLNLLMRLRPEIKFPNPHELIEQIKQDVLSAKKYFGL